jgi:ATP-dependent helicase/nuclease subunit A
VKRATPAPDQRGLFDPDELADQPARDIAVERIGSSVVVTAGAGAGKTETLIKRLGKVLDAEGDASRIVAITFTDRAARDLVAKLRRKLPAKHRASVEQMQVGTIHSFCLRILRRHPLEAGLPPVFTTADELMSRTDAAARRLRIIRIMFDDIATADDHEARTALALLVEVNATYHLDALVDRLDAEWDAVGRSTVAPAPDWRPMLADALTAAEEAATSADCTDKVRWKPQAAADELRRMIALGDDVVGVHAMLDRWKPESHWGKVSDLRQQMMTARAECLGAMRHAAFAVLWRRLAPVVHAEALGRLAAGQVSFDDILVLTRRLLTTVPEVRRRLRAEIDHLCVDEFQDTDRVQFDIVRLLSDPEPDASGPVLFAVGDPKQSIYAFRDADVALFGALQRSDRHEQVELTTNFRSRPEVLRWVNRTFDPWFRADAVVGQVVFRPLDAHVADAPSNVVVLGGLVDGSAAEAAIAQADDIVAAIVTAHDRWMCRVEVNTAEGEEEVVERPATFGDIAVLVRTRNDLATLEPALRQAGVPYVIEGGSLLYETREVRELLTVAHAVADTASAIKAVNALRTSVLAISDIELARHRAAGGRWWLPRPGDEPAGHPVVLDALRRIRRWADDRHRVALPELLARIAGDVVSRSASAVDDDPVTTWRRLRFVLDEARWWFEQTGGSLTSYLEWVAVRIEQLDRGNVTTDETDHDAVHILTMHAAKGLEYPVVIVAGLGRGSAGRDHVQLHFVESDDVSEGAAGGFTVEATVGKIRTSGSAAFNSAAADANEAARLAYVACTRARDHLVVCVHHASRNTSSPAGRLLAFQSDDPTPLDRDPVPVVHPPDLVPLDLPAGQAASRPPDRAAAWTVRSSWSATQLPPDALPDLPRSAAVAVGAASGDADGIPAETDSVDPDVSPHAKHPRPFGASPDRVGRYGTRIGRAVHGVVQLVDLLDPRRDLDGLVSAQCVAEEVPERWWADVAALVTSVLDAPLFARMVAVTAAGGTVRREMYVGAEVTGADGTPVAVYGIVDAVWVEDGRLIVVDVKTDHAAEPDDVLVARYRTQLQAYADALTATTGLDVAEALLCVARPDSGPAVTVPVPLHSPIAPR